MTTKLPMFEFVIDRKIAILRPRHGGGPGRGAARGRADRRRDPGRAAAPRVRADPGPPARDGSDRRARRGPPATSAAHQARRRRPRSATGAAEAAPERRRRRSPASRIRTLPRTGDAQLERDALMGALQYGHQLDAELLQRAMSMPFTVPALDAVREAIAQIPDRRRPGWALQAVDAVREPYRSLAGELLMAAFPAKRRGGCQGVLDRSVQAARSCADWIGRRTNCSARSSACRRTPTAAVRCARGSSRSTLERQKFLES